MIANVGVSHKLGVDGNGLKVRRQTYVREAWGKRRRDRAHNGGVGSLDICEDFYCLGLLFCGQIKQSNRHVVQGTWCNFKNGGLARILYYYGES